MIITNILHVSGTKADLYSASFFKGVENKRKPVNPFTKWVDGHLFAYGMIKDVFGPVRICIDLRAAKEACGFTGEGDDPMGQINSCVVDDSVGEAAALPFKIVNPPVPPSKSYTAWDYRHKDFEYQFSTWEVEEGQYGKWVASTEVETRYYGPNKKELVPQLTRDEVAQPFKQYYYIDKYDLPAEPHEKFVNTDELTLGESIPNYREALQSYYELKYPELAKAGKIDVQIYEVDITQAEQVPTATEHDQYLMGHWLGHYEEYPTMISVDGNNNVIASYGNWKEPFMEGDYEYRHSLPDAVFDFKKALVDRKTTLPICNGLCCYPRLIEDRIYANQGQRLSYNKRDRNRRWVLVDFSPVGGCSFIPLKDLKGGLTSLQMPEFDHTKQSCLLVVKGRLFTPEEFEIINDKILLFDITKYTGVYELDRMVCRGDHNFNCGVIDNTNEKVSRANERVVSEMVGVYDDNGPVFVETGDSHLVHEKEYHVLHNGKYVLADVSAFTNNYTLTEDLRIERTKAYFVKYKGSWVLANIPRNLIGKPFGPEYKYDIGIVDEWGTPVLFNEFYEYVPSLIDEDHEYDVGIRETEIRVTSDVKRNHKKRYLIQEGDSYRIATYQDYSPTDWGFKDGIVYYEEVTVIPKFSHFYEFTKRMIQHVEFDWKTTPGKFKYDLKDDDNSFLIVINKPNLQVVRHKCWEGSWPITKMPWGSDSHAGTMKCDFDQPARGLLFDESTRSVIDYTREIQTMTFYADKERRWGISNTHVNWQTLLAVTDESSDNLMSARGFVLDDVHADKYDHVVWPRLTILDFIFRG